MLMGLDGWRLRQTEEPELHCGLLVHCMWVQRRLMSGLLDPHHFGFP